MRKATLTLLAIVVLIATPGLVAQAEDSTAPASPSPAKPAVVVCAGSYNQWYGNVEAMGRLTGNPDLAKGLEAMLKLATGNRALDGLDKTRPLGALVIPTPDNPKGGTLCLYVPVTNLKELLSTGLEPFRLVTEEQDEGIYRVRPRGRRSPVFVTQRNGWALVVEKREQLEAVPADPTPWLDKLTKQYDLAVQIHVANLPPKVHEFIAARLERAEERMPPIQGENAVQREQRRRVIGAIAKAILTAARDLDQFTVGWVLDDETGRSVVDISVTAQPDTPTARHFAHLRGAQTRFAGFRLPEAMVTGSWACNRSTANPSVVDLVFAMLDQQAERDINAKTPDADRANDKKHLAKLLFGIARGMVLGDRVDGAVTLIVQPEAATFLTAQYVADMTKLEGFLKLLVETATKYKPELAKQIHLDADEFQGVRLHTASFPVPPKAKDRARVVRLVGETIDVVVGVGDENVYVAVGRDAMKTLKRAIAASAQQGPQPAVPLQWSVSAAEIAEAAAALGRPKDRDRAALVAKALKKTNGKDHLNVSVVPIDRGLCARVELEEGLLQIPPLLRSPLPPDVSLSDQP
ncbi:MAG: hypothetical protein JW818_01365 [Pirellulales bacterium]|nr:hypothetical protein [Pirellulales bacterium]